MFDGEGTAPSLPTDAGDAFEQAFLEAGAAPSGAPTTEPAAPADEPAAPGEPSTAAPPRDEQGRFIAKPPAAEPAATTEPAPAPETPTEPTADAEVEPAPAAEPAAAPEASYRYDGQDAAIPGSAVGADGVFIPQAQWPDTSRLLAAGRSAIEGSIRQRLSASAERERRVQQERDTAHAERDHVLASIDQMIEDGKIADWLEGVTQNWPILKAEARAKAIEQQNAAYKQRLDEVEAAQERTQLEPQMLSALENTVQHYGTKAGLAEPLQRELVQRLNSPRFRSQVFVQATEDDPANGIRQGEWLIDYGVVQEEVALVQRLTAASQQQKVAAAEQANRARGQPNPTPPTVGARRGPPPPATGAKKSYSSAEEADADIWGAGFNDLLKR